MEPRQTFLAADLLSVGASFCYIYTLHASNDPECRPRYVGFTCDPKEREKRHNQRRKNGGRRALWIQELKTQEARVVLSVVHTFRSKDLGEWAVVEATWIEAYRKKFPDLLNDAGGGEGIARPSEALKKKFSAIVKKHFADPAKREEMSQKLKEFFSDPKERERLSRTQKLRFQDPEVRRKMSISRKQIWENPEHKAKQTMSRKRVWANAEHRAKRSAETKQLWSDPEYRAKRKASADKAYAKPEVREKLKEATKKLWADPVWRAKRAATIARKQLEKLLNEF